MEQVEAFKVGVPRVIELLSKLAKAETQSTCYLASVSRSDLDDIKTRGQEGI